jgi:hypothetical protein
MLNCHAGQNADSRQDAHRAIALRFKLFTVWKLLCASRVLLRIWIKKMLVWISTRSLRTRDEDTWNSVYSSKLLPCTIYKEERNNEMLVWQLRWLTYTVRSSVRFLNARDSMVWSRRTLLSTLQKVIKREYINHNLRYAKLFEYALIVERFVIFYCKDGGKIWHSSIKVLFLNRTPLKIPSIWNTTKR